MALSKHFKITPAKLFLANNIIARRPQNRSMSSSEKLQLKLLESERLSEKCYEVQSSCCYLQNIVPSDSLAYTKNKISNITKQILLIVDRMVLQLTMNGPSRTVHVMFNTDLCSTHQKNQMHGKKTVGRNRL